MEALILNLLTRERDTNKSTLLVRKIASSERERKWHCVFPSFLSVPRGCRCVVLPFRLSLFSACPCLCYVRVLLALFNPLYCLVVLPRQIPPPPTDHPPLLCSHFLPTYSRSSQKRSSGMRAPSPPSAPKPTTYSTIVWRFLSVGPSHGFSRILSAGRAPFTATRAVR